MKKCKLLFFASVSVLLLTVSCSRDENQVLPENNKHTGGRFDNKPFSWDTQTHNDPSLIFLGDLNIGVDNSIGNTKRGEFPVEDGNIFMTNSNVYPGAVFPSKSIYNQSFDSEIRYPKNPYDLNFMFSNPYVIEDIDSPKGLSNYNRKMSEAISTPNFNNHINSGYKKEVKYAATELYSYEDVKKSFSFNVGFANVFTAKMSQNKHSEKYKSIFFARLVSTSFDVIFEQNADGFFKSDKINKDLLNNYNDNNGFRESGSTEYFPKGQPYFIKQLFYGKLAYLSIESEYSYSEVKSAIEATFSLWKVSAGAEYSEETKRVLSKSVITLFTTGDSSTDSYWSTSLENLSSIFKTNYNSNFYGYPVYTQIRDVRNDAIYIPKIETNTSSTGGSNNSNSGVFLGGGFR